MIGLTFITQFVYWFRGLKIPGVTASQRRRARVKRTAEPLSPDSFVNIYPAPNEQPWGVGLNSLLASNDQIEDLNLGWCSYDKSLGIQDHWGVSSQDAEPRLLKYPRANFNGSALGGSELIEYNPMNPYGDAASYSGRPAWNANGSVIENPERMEWISFYNGVRLLEPPEQIQIEVTSTESQNGSRPMSQQSLQTAISNSQDDNDTEKRRRWERNEIDYMDQDSFQNILTKLEMSLNT